MRVTNGKFKKQNSLVLHCNIHDQVRLHVRGATLLGRLLAAGATETSGLLRNEPQPDSPEIWYTSRL